MSSRVAIVTGASKGIGAAIAQRLAREGYAVCVTYLNHQREAENLINDIVKSGGKAIGVRVDMGVEADIVNMFEATARDLGTPTALVNNAAMILFEEVEKMRWPVAEKLLMTNVLGVMACCREAFVRMKKSGGAIVNIGSEAGRFGGNNMSVYAASKAAVHTFTTGFARETAPFGVRVNAVSPGIIDTGIHEPERAKLIPMGRMGKPEEVANAVAWLLSDEASFVSGAVLPVSGAR